jgi:hypothetical protein
LLTLTALAIFVSTALPLSHASAGPHFVNDVPNADLWRRVYAQMPEAWKTDRLILVRQLTESQMDRLIDDIGGNDNQHGDTVVDGCYQSGGAADEAFGTISLRETLHGELAAFVFAHEYGHYVWDDLLTEEQRSSYTHLWKVQKRAKHLVTGYAGDSVDEGFAEAFAHFLRKPALLRKRDPRSAAFLTNLLTLSKQAQPTPAARP